MDQTQVVSYLISRNVNGGSRVLFLRRLIDGPATGPTSPARKGPSGGRLCAMAALTCRRVLLITDENKAVVERWFSEVVSRGDMACLDDICAACHP